MSNKKQRKRQIEELCKPHILTYAQALALDDEKAVDDQARRRSAEKALSALDDRVRCRFTGPSNFSNLTYGERMIWDLRYMEGEVLNGGFHQYLTNSTGESAEDIKRYLRDIGAVQTSGLFDRLSRLFPSGVIPRDREWRTAIVEEWEAPDCGSDVFDELDSCFYRQSENLAVLMVTYARTHPADFAEPSDEIVNTLKRQDRITAFYCGTAEPEWVAGAEAALRALEDHVKRLPTAFKQIQALAGKGKKMEAIRLYRELFTCSLAVAKAAVERIIDPRKP
jgi:ribosomal protein L7/L12